MLSEAATKASIYLRMKAKSNFQYTTWPQICISQYRNTRNMGKQSNITPPKLNDYIVTLTIGK
jgi:hypothetical protein